MLLYQQQYLSFECPYYTAILLTQGDNNYNYFKHLGYLTNAVLNTSMYVPYMMQTILKDHFIYKYTYKTLSK